MASRFLTQNRFLTLQKYKQLTGVSFAYRPLKMTIAHDVAERLVLDSIKAFHKAYPALT